MSNSNDGGSTPQQYGLPEGATELQDLIEYRGMNFALGNIFKACYRRGTCSHSDELRDMRKIAWFAEREIARLEADKGRLWPPSSDWQPSTEPLVYTDEQLLDSVARQEAAKGKEKGSTLEAVREHIAATNAARATPPTEPEDVPDMWWSPVRGDDDDAKLSRWMDDCPVKSCVNCKHQGIEESAEPCKSCDKFDAWEAER